MPVQRGNERVFRLQKDSLTCRAGFFKRIQAGVVPMEHHRQRAVFQIRYVDFDGVGLADAIQAANALLEQIGIQRQIEQHQMMGKLEIAAFAADFRADQHLAAGFLVGKERRGAVAFDQAHAFVEYRNKLPGRFFHRLRQIARGAR